MTSRSRLRSLRRWLVRHARLVEAATLSAAVIVAAGLSAEAVVAGGDRVAQTPVARNATVDRTVLPPLRGEIAFSHNDDVWIANADGTQPKRLTRRAGPEFDPSWSPDGSRIVYRDSRRGINNNDEIYVMNADGTHARNLTRSPIDEWSPSWSPDGKQIAFFAGDLWVMRPDGRGAHSITKVEAEYPAWTRDSKRIAFMSAQPNARGSDPNYDIVVVNRDGSHLRKLTSWRGEDGWPAWSPDGKLIAYASTQGAGPHGTYVLYVMRQDGSHKHRLTDKVWGSFPVWAPDGRMIMFTGGRVGQTDDDHLWIVRPDGSGLRQLPLRGWLVDWRR